mgnify:CR=1 FL=1
MIMYHLFLLHIDLIVENNIKNPNLIFPNEVLKINTDIEKQVIKSGNNDASK